MQQIRADEIARVLREVDEADPRVGEGLDHRLRPVRAGIPHHQQFPVCEGLVQHASNRKRQHLGPVIRRGDDGDGGCRHDIR